MLKTFVSTILLFISTYSFAQLTLQQKLQSNLPLEAQFQALLLQSRNQDVDFKIIRKSNVEIIQKNVKDSITKYTKEIAALKNNSSSSVQRAQTLQDSVVQLSAALDIEKRKTDSISFFGIEFSKTTYHLLVWSLIGLFAIGFIIMLASFRKAKIDAVEHQKTSEEVQSDFLAFKKKSMEAEQKLKRQLLDEQMKRDN